MEPDRPQHRTGTVVRQSLNAAARFGLCRLEKADRKEIPPSPTMITYIRERFHPLWRLRRQAWFRALQRRVDFPVRTGAGRIKFHVMLLRDFSVLAPHREVEAVSRQVFAEMVRRLPATHFFDIGANVGAYAWSAREEAPEAELFLFEPDPVNRKLLQKTIQRNALAGVHLWEGVVAASGGTRTFYVDEASGTVGSLHDDSGKGHSLQSAYQVAQSITVAATTLDDYVDAMRGERPEVVVKVDVEGAEAEVLAGAREFIRRFRPLFLMECFDRENLRVLRELDYVFFDLRENANYLLAPRERLAELTARGILPLGNLVSALTGSEAQELATPW
jgi:FkbM family methyltransferase